ncbi:catechol 1,2-dioxygenase [Rhizorhabdus wittichii]|uniref:Catechol 1,2-dioxygenase n=1 Tax=Rhizorhabdus wittichii TaxID=160791 RepID=A0A975D1H2_9SPHN|nr:dioxygenase [Rhizorhabdus wittichii]QTH21425.1 catechol 1,2-dioxygenase [Rhizorhabdus wittichii]
MIIDHQADLTLAVELAMARTPDPRLREVMAALVRHAHAFVREVRPTDEEFERGIDFLIGIGQATDEKKNEVVLAADVLGISSLVGLLNKPLDGVRTAPALLGPFWRRNAPECAPGDSIVRCAVEGERLLVRGSVRDPAGRPIAEARIDVWQASPVGLYENQDDGQPEMNLRGLFTADAAGAYHFETVRPAGYPVPTDGPVGDLLRAQRRHPYRPAHIHFMVTAPGHATLVTQIFADEQDRLETDVTFGVLEPLVARFEPKEGGNLQVLRCDFVLEAGETRIPKAPIP